MLVYHLAKVGKVSICKGLHLVIPEETSETSLYGASIKNEVFFLVSKEMEQIICWYQGGVFHLYNYRKTRKNYSTLLKDNDEAQQIW